MFLLNKKQEEVQGQLPCLLFQWGGVCDIQSTSHMCTLYLAQNGLEVTWVGGGGSVTSLKHKMASLPQLGLSAE